MRETLAAAAETKLTRTEFAVIRAYAQGMSPVDIAQRYLSDPDDDDHLTEAEAIRKIMGLRDRLIQFALQHSRPDIAQMFEALRARSDIGMTRRVDALASLEGLGQTRPQPEHEVGLWFRLSLSRRLTAAGIRRISDLVELANARGSSWWRRAPGIGAKSAEIITRWLIARQGSGMPGKPMVKAYVRPPSEAGKLVPGPALPLGPGMPHPVPLERMLAPADGGPLGDQLREVRQWLDGRPLRASTRHSYRREAERLLLWAARERLSLDGLSGDDLRRYGQFLLAPSPAEFWCGPATVRRHIDWRPFEGPLSASSAAASLRVVRALLRAREKTRGGAPRVPAVPLPGMVAGEIAGRADDATPEQIAAFMEWLRARSEVSPRMRAAYVAACLIRYEKMRLSHISHLRCAQLRDTGDGPIWNLVQANAVPSQLHEESAQAIRGHWRDRRAVGASVDAASAVLAPIMRPPTPHSRAKEASQAEAGYSSAGLEKLLRWCWKRFADTGGLSGVRFTPKRLQQACAPPDAARRTAGS